LSDFDQKEDCCFLKYNGDYLSNMRK